MAELYLIAHLVRGEPAFDIAIKLPIGDEEGWIIPTSGHRAYPYWEHPLYDILQDLRFDGGVPPPPADHPDHYTTSAAPTIRNLAERLGFIPKPPTIARR